MKDKVQARMASEVGRIAILIDPEKTNCESQLLPLIQKCQHAGIDFFFVGGSTVSRADLEKTVSLLKKHSSIPVVLFPGSSAQLSEEADALLFLSLVSGRNPDFLITHHVNCAEEVFSMNLEVIPTAYLLIDGGSHSSVAYVSQTTPIPREQHTIAIKTALAAYLQGKKTIYFDAGSGAKQSVPPELILQLKKKIDIPVIVGGGIRNIETIQQFAQAGANVIVIGNHIEHNLDFILDIASYQQNKKC